MAITWVDIREKLNSELISESFNKAELLFDDGKQIDAKIDREEWEEDWLILSFGYDDEGVITIIFVLDEKAIHSQ